MYCFAQFCRLCIRTDRNLVNIFYIDDDLQTLSDKMRSILPEIVYDEDNIPNLVCDQCCSNVKKFYEFRKKSLKNNEVLKLYASKLLRIKEAPENIDLENELKLIQKQILEENTDVDLSLIFMKQGEIKQEIDEKPEVDCKLEQDVTTEISVTIKDEPLDDIKTDLIKSESNPFEPSSPASSSSSSDSESDHQEFEERELVVNKNSSTLEETRTYSRKSVIGSNKTSETNDIREHEPDLKLECTEEDDESFSEDHGDESMDCDEVISINDSENENADEDMINIPEPMNLTARALNNTLVGNLDSPNMGLPPHLASGNRAVEYSWALTHKNRCTYYGCTTRIHDRKEITMFKFPCKNKERLDQWVKNIGNATLKTFSVDQLSNYYVCAKHFALTSFRASINNKRRLNFTAVPLPLLPEDVPEIPVTPENNDSEPNQIEKEISEIDIQEVKPVKRPIYTYSRKRKMEGSILFKE